MEVPDGKNFRVSLAREDVMPWIEASVGARLNADVLDKMMPPKEGSFLRPTTDDPLRNMGWWCHGYLESAVDHMLLWADCFAPLKFHPESETVHTLRPIFTLARAAMESAAQAIWILSPEELVTCVDRYFQLALWDLDEQTKAAMDEEERAELQQCRENMFAVLGLTRRKFSPPKYIDMIRAAAVFLPTDNVQTPMAPESVERIWRSAAGAAHGKQWTEFELHERVDAGGGFVYSTPKIQAISEVLDVADKFLRAGVLLFAKRSGHMEDFRDLWEDATNRLAEQITPVGDVAFVDDRQE